MATTREYETAMAWILTNDMTVISHMIEACYLFVIAVPRHDDYFKEYLAEPRVLMPFTDAVKIKKGLLEIFNKDEKQSYEKFIIQCQEFIRQPSRTSLLLWLDFIFYIVKINGDLPLAKSKRERDKFYNYVFRPLRGYRRDKKNPPKRNFYGITRTNILPMKSSTSFVKWGQDVCRVKQTTEASWTASQVAPAVCGISGSSFMVWWQFVSEPTTMTTQQILYFIMAIWCCLCLDGGHSLQEVISAFDIACTWKHWQLKGKISPTIVSVWANITAYDMNDVGEYNYKSISDSIKLLKNRVYALKGKNLSDDAIAMIENHIKAYKKSIVPAGQSNPYTNYNFILRPVTYLLDKHPGFRIIMTGAYNK